MRYILTVLMLILDSGALLAQESGAFPLPVKEHIYPNGLRLLVLERPGDTRVAAKIFTDMGALNEIPGALGAAHFQEHLMFKGTHTLGTLNWNAEAPIRDAITATENALIAELDRARNTLQERGVFQGYSHLSSTPRADSLRAEIARLEAAAAPYRDNGAMMRWYQAFGGSGLTATTEQEYMKFDINLPRSRIALFFRVEADRMRNSVFREFDQERMILVEQRYGDLNRPVTPYYEQLNAAVGLVHPVFWPEGYPTDFAQYTRAYQRELYERYFVPNNTTIVLVGGVDFDLMVTLGDQYFGRMNRAPEPTRVRAVEPVPSAERRVMYRSATLQPRVEARYLIPGVGHPDRPLFDVLLDVAGRALSSALREAGVGGTINANTRVVHTSRFGVPASINFEIILNNAADLESAEDVLLSTVERLRVEGVDLERLSNVKKRLKTEWYRLSMSADRLAFEIGHFQMMDSWKTLKPYLQAREDATPAELMRVAREYFVADNRTIGYVQPLEPEPVGATSRGGR